MPLKLNVGASRKVTDHNYGSRGASVNLEAELDTALVEDAPRLRARIRHLFGLARASLQEELERNGGRPTTAGRSPSTTYEETGLLGPPPAASTNLPSRRQLRGSTPGQCRALYAIARARGVDLAVFLTEQFGVGGPDELTLVDASRAIDGLKGLPRSVTATAGGESGATDEAEELCRHAC
jgi:hypothetical protein